MKERCEVEIYTDSKYVKHGITEWFVGWKKRGWKGANKKPIKNIDLWERLDSITQKHAVSWHWVKGHADDPYNIRVDELAVRAVRK